MIAAMLLAHLAGDYILQWDGLANWKSRALSGVVFHSLIVLAVTYLFAWLVNPHWWFWVLFIGVFHFLIDAFQLRFRPAIAPLIRFFLDQLAHLFIIGAALFGGGYLDGRMLQVGLPLRLAPENILVFLLPLAFVTMPAWVVVKFAAYGLVRGTAPDFGGSNKYLGMMERLLIVLFVALGQFYMIPVIIFPRFFLEWPIVLRQGDTAVYLAELFLSVILATAAGILLSML